VLFGAMPRFGKTFALRGAGSRCRVGQHVVAAVRCGVADLVGGLLWTPPLAG
jgi:hypothetical protein